MPFADIVNAAQFRIFSEALDQHRAANGIGEPHGREHIALLEVLQRVFDKLCNERRLALKDTDQREQLAGEIVRIFQRGVIDETELWRALSKRSRRWMPTS
jgi:hypothetical protein